MQSSIRRAGALLAATGLALTLASCSGGQSVEEACAIAEETMTDVVADSNTEAQDALTSALQGEDVNFEGLFTPVEDALKETQDKISNEEVSAALDTFTSEYSAFVDTIEGFDLSAYQELSELSELDPSDPDYTAKITELQEKNAALQEDATKLQEDITTQQQSLTSASEKLSSLCGAN